MAGNAYHVPLDPAPDPPRRTETRREWFGDAVTELLPQLTATARRFTRDTTDAEDLVADAVARAWRGLSSLEDRANFRAWIFRILTNTWISHCRARKSRPEPEPLPADDEPFSLFERLHQPFLLWWGNPEQAFLNTVLRQDLCDAVDALPEEYRTAVVLADMHGFSYREISEMIDVPVGTVRSRLARGRARLQAALWDHARDRGWVDARSPDEDRAR